MIFKIIGGGESIDASMISVGLSHEDNEQIVFRSIWKPLKKSNGPLASRQIANLKKYHDLLQNKTLKLEDVEWPDLDKPDQGCEDYQLLFIHQDGLYRIKFDFFDGEQGRLSQNFTSSESVSSFIIAIRNLGCGNSL